MCVCVFLISNTHFFTPPPQVPSFSSTDLSVVNSKSQRYALIQSLAHLHHQHQSRSVALCALADVLRLWSASSGDGDGEKAEQSESWMALHTACCVPPEVDWDTVLALNSFPTTTTTTTTTPTTTRDSSVLTSEQELSLLAQHVHAPTEKMLLYGLSSPQEAVWTRTVSIICDAVPGQPPLALPASAMTASVAALVVARRSAVRLIRSPLSAASFVSALLSSQADPSLTSQCAQQMVAEGMVVEAGALLARRSFGRAFQGLDVALGLVSRVGKQ